MMLKNLETSRAVPVGEGGGESSQALCVHVQCNWQQIADSLYTREQA